jgi:hypothetical protein
MAKYVQDTNAAKSISAFIILDKKGKLVAKVQAHYGNSTVLVNVFDYTGNLDMQAGKASGYGYDKFTAALSGLIIDGHTMADHCGKVPECEEKKAKLMKAYLADNRPYNESAKEYNEKARKLGARWANFNTEKGKFTSLHFESGLNRLQMLGYQVIQAI